MTGLRSRRVPDESEELDIKRFDNQSQTVSVISGVNLAMLNAVPAGCTEVHISWLNGATLANTEAAFIRWDAAAVETSCMRVMPGDSYILKVPNPGTSKLNCIGITGVTAGSSIIVTPLG